MRRRNRIINQSHDYKSAGVDIDAGNALVETIKPLARSTARAGSAASLGGFGALFDLKAAGFHDPLLLATTDGVGTKLRLALDSGIHNGIGIDLVAMCVNDLIVQGAEPLLFLDYYACGKLDVNAARAVITGIAEGCRRAGCALAGGETAEMPGHYQDNDYDLAGFALGAVERDKLITGATITTGDIVLGLTSSGVHSNGFSLVRAIIKDSALALSAPAPFAAGQTLGEALLTPTMIYVKPVLTVHKRIALKGLAHITGGGLIENIPRVLPAGLGAVLDGTAWHPAPVFQWLKAGGIASAEMLRVFNCGIGMVAVVARENVAASISVFQAEGIAAVPIGAIVAVSSTAPRVEIDHSAKLWQS